MKFDNFNYDSKVIPELNDWVNEQYPNETMIVYIRFLKGSPYWETQRREQKFTTFIWEIWKKNQTNYGSSCKADWIESITIYDWETKERIGTYEPVDFLKYWNK